MARLPRFGAQKDPDPHVFILGAGASVAACPDGDRNGRRLPVMANFVEVWASGTCSGRPRSITTARTSRVCMTP